MIFINIKFAYLHTTCCQNNTYFLLLLGYIVTTESIIVDLKLHLLNALDKNIINVKQACDALIRVSLAQPSHQLILPTHKMSKVN